MLRAPTQRAIALLVANEVQQVGIRFERESRWGVIGEFARSEYRRNIPSRAKKGSDE